MVHGRLYLPGSTEPIDVRLEAHGGEIELLTPDGQQRLYGTERRKAFVPSRIGNVAREIELPGGAIFETRDNDAVDRELASQAARVVPMMERSKLSLVALIALLMAVVGAGPQFGVPLALKAAVSVTSVAVEETIGDATLASLDSAMFFESQASEARRENLTEQFDRLIDVYRQRADARQDSDFRLYFRSSPDLGPNAIALPGGQVIVTDELLDLIDDDEAIVAVLAHEIGHVHYRHGLFKIYRSVGVGGLMIFIGGGDTGQLASQAVVQGAVLSNLAVSREMEREADHLSVELVLAAGMNPMKLTVALNALENICPECATANLLSTHPGLHDRREVIADALENR